ncbi:DUF2182 domain-containing protein [Tepidamorphus sp. 3E244]|uniref:DUF2182 domain-containing protein n=1 Tax=Tepidamorphus sp. 3E244 TaxID=3385498 RepID=UPI0038FCD38D
MQTRFAITKPDQQRVVASALVLLGASGLWLALIAWMNGHGVHGAETCLGLTPLHVAEHAGMWMVMMAAMMLPAAAPAVSMYASLVARDPETDSAGLRTASFVAGYVIVWSLVSLGFAAAQIVLGRSGVFGQGGTLAGPLGAGFLLLAAGLYELTNLKQACLTRCRNPMTFFIARWREGARGALDLGLRHGVHCVGCCIAMMGLMFVFGAMNVVWMALLTVYFVAEKIVPGAATLSRHAGLILAGAGVLVIASVAAGLWPAGGLAISMI